MSKKAWIIFIAAIVVVFGGLILLSRSNQIDVTGINKDTVTTASSKNGNIADHVYGKASSPVVLIEYGDFQCPYCGETFPSINKVTQKYKDQIAFIFRNFPLTSSHPNALFAAAAAEAAGLQHKYWDYYNIVYSSQSDWENLTGSQRDDKFISYAKQLNLNISTFKNDLSSKRVNQKILFDQALGKSANISGTPTLFLNGQKIDDDTLSELTSSKTTKLETQINAQLKQHNIEPPKN